MIYWSKALIFHKKHFLNFIAIFRKYFFKKDNPAIISHVSRNILKVIMKSYDKLTDGLDILNSTFSFLVILNIDLYFNESTFYNKISTDHFVLGILLDIKCSTALLGSLHFFKISKWIIYNILFICHYIWMLRNADFHHSNLLLG
jgi:hypothetical protein